MTDLTLYFVATAGLAALMAAAVLSAPRSFPLKVGAVAVLAMLMPTVYMGLSTMLSRPKPVEIELLARPAKDAEVVASYMKEGEAIYVWLKLPGADEPRAYRLPWNEKQARELRQAERAADEAGTQVAMRRPFGNHPTDSIPVFHPMPQKPLPPKQTAEGPAPYAEPIRPHY